MHRTYETIQGLSDRLGVAIVTAYAEGEEPQLASNVVSQYPGVALICWEHDHIPSLASSLPTVAGTAIPQAWPGGRFDVVWTFTVVPDRPPPSTPSPRPPSSSSPETSPPPSSPPERQGR